MKELSFLVPSREALFPSLLLSFETFFRSLSRDFELCFSSQQSKTETGALENFQCMYTRACAVSEERLQRTHQERREENAEEKEEEEEGSVCVC